MCIHIPIVDFKNKVSEKLSILCICMYLHTCIQHLTLHTITVLPLTTVYIVSEVHCTSNVQYLTLLSLHTITALPLTTVYFVSEVHCTLNVLHSITP